MLSRRIVPCLDVKDGRVVKGVRFLALRDAGDPAELGRAYALEGADELVFLDISATPEARRTAVGLAERVAREAFIPFTVGGGLRTVEEMRAVLHAGADRVAVNTAAVRDPGLIGRAAERFGSQAVVVAIDAYRERDGWRVRVRSGTEEAGLDAVEWAARAAELGAGEILLTSIDRDGTRAGYDLELLRAVCRTVPVPVIASGGAGAPEHFARAFDSGAAAALAASLFHFGELRIPDLKRWLLERSHPIRPFAPEGAPTLSPQAEREVQPDGELRPAVVQAPDGRVVMLAYMDRAALERTIRTGRVTFYSRSRRRLWTKGETSGHWLEVRSVRSDCDGDALLVVARPHGPTCHTGTATCFEAGETLLPAARQEPAAAHEGETAVAHAGETPAAPTELRDLAEALAGLWAVIARRDRERPEDSYTTRLLEAGVPRIAQKLGEEAVEAALAAVGRPERLPAESADLLYHLLVLWKAAGTRPQRIARELRRRRAAGEEGEREPE